MLLAASSFADLQNVQVGGSIRVRGDWYTGAGGPDKTTTLRHSAEPGRPEVNSPYFGWNKHANDNAWVEQRTRLNVKADFTDAVSAFIELDSYSTWGESFRSNYLTGVDSRSGAGTEAFVYQAYIESSEMFGTPLRLRIGRQELKFGNQFLLGVNDVAAFFYGLSYDAVRATYAIDKLTLDAFWAKLAENSPVEQDGDVDLYGVYASYTGIENVTLDAYYLFLRDARKRAVTNSDPMSEWIERAAGVDDYGVTNLSTVGLRGNGKFGPLDFEAEAAYQFGDADAMGITFAGSGFESPYGPTHARWGAFGANAEVGYTFDIKWSPRIYIGGAYLGGEDKRALNFGEWMSAEFNPFYKGHASVSFNRLFGNYAYSEFIDTYMDHSNAWIARCGGSIAPTEKTKIQLLATHFEALEAYAPSTVPPFGFIHSKNSSNLGTELEVIGSYNYTADLSFALGYAHLFVGKGLEEGSFNHANGLIFSGGTRGDDADYVFFETKLTF